MIIPILFLSTRDSLSSMHSGGFIFAGISSVAIVTVYFVYQTVQQSPSHHNLHSVSITRVQLKIAAWILDSKCDQWSHDDSQLNSCIEGWLDGLLGM